MEVVWRIEMKKTPQWFGTNFKKYFPDFDPGELIDPLLIQAGKGCCINILRLEAKLEGIHGTIPDGISMADFVTEHYGEEATEWVREAL
jgi:hypothetical protein